MFFEELHIFCIRQCCS